MKQGSAIAGMLILAVLAGSAAVRAEVYRWVDENGEVHFSDRPRSGANTVRVPKAPASAPSDAGRAERQRRLLEAWQAERLRKQEAERRAEDQARLRRRNCAIARDNLRQYRNAGGVYRLNENGERVFMDDAERGRLIAQWEGEVARWCD
ncbi:DUF4124 domain-containing protein [Thiohalobacter sp.]|uniref:DUF4124 domain-containing protein n=1 Tax=Thiohalobacter sp. TaxID=2025948 RepID=UPI002622AAB6|nr:DUF4124 domain-containing protein [Thiohalobacter sp.]